MNSPPDIQFNGEVFNTLFKDESRWSKTDPYHSFEQYRQSILKKSADSPVDRGERLAYLQALKNKASHAVVGVDFKYWMWEQFKPVELQNLSSEFDTWIHLIRRDPFRAEVSNYLRIHNPHLTMHDEVKYQIPAQRLFESILERVQMVRAFRKFIAKKTALEFFYEDLFPSRIQNSDRLHPDVVSRLLNAFNLPTYEMRTNRIKSSPLDMSDRIVNYNELFAVYQNQIFPHLQQHELLL